MAELRRQVEELATALESSRQETQDLRNQTDRSLRDLQEQCTAAKLAAKSDAVEHDYMRLIDEKVNRPPVFDGNRKEVRGWARSVKAYLDSKYPGFRRMLTVIERSQAFSNEHDLQQSGWKWALPANKSLYNMLISYTKGEAQIMLENSDPDQGFECWRKLIQHYDPQGGDNELTTINGLLSVPRCKRLNDIITTVEAWEREWANYSDRTKETLPERWKVSLLLRMIPVENEREIRLRYVKSKDITYAELRENLFAWVQQNAVGAVGMHIGSMSAEELAEQKLAERLAEANRYALLAEHDRRDHGDDDDDDDNLTTCDEISLLKKQHETELNALRLKGGGPKGGKKGQGRQKGAQRGTATTGPTPKKFTGDCSYCKKTGHKAKECRKRLSDLKKKEAGLLDSDLGCGILDIDRDFDDNDLFAPLKYLGMNHEDPDGDEEEDDDDYEDVYIHDDFRLCGDCPDDDDDELTSGCTCTCDGGGNDDDAEQNTDMPLFMMEIDSVTGVIADERLEQEMSEFIARRDVDDNSRALLAVEDRACAPSIHGTSLTQQQQQPQQQQQQQTLIVRTPEPEQRPIVGLSPHVGIEGSPLTAGTTGSTISTAERFRQRLDELAATFAVTEAGSIPIPQSLREHDKPPGLGEQREVREISTQTDIQLGKSTWVVTLNADRQDDTTHHTVDQEKPEGVPSPSEDIGDGQNVEKFEDDDEDDCLAVDCIDCALDSDTEPEPKHPDEYEYRRDKLREYGIEDADEVATVAPDVNFGKQRRRAAAKLRKRALAALKSDNVLLPRPDELAPKAGGSASFGNKSDGSQPDKSTTISTSTSLSPSDWHDLVTSCGHVMLIAIVLSSAVLATEVIDCDIDEKELKSEQPLLTTEKETVKKTLGQKLQEKLKSMIRIRRGFTVDSGAADHVMPLGWLAWIIVTASLGSLSGVNFISANGAKIPNKGEQKVRFMTPEGTWATWIFQVAGINKPLVSVSKLIADGWRVIFDEERSYLQHKATGHTIDLKCERGIFTVDAYVESVVGSPGFTRQA